MLTFDPEVKTPLLVIVFALLVVGLFIGCMESGAIVVRKITENTLRHQHEYKWNVGEYSIVPATAAICIGCGDVKVVGK